MDTPDIDIGETLALPCTVWELESLLPEVNEQIIYLKDTAKKLYGFARIAPLQTELNQSHRQKRYLDRKMKSLCEHIKLCGLERPSPEPVLRYLPLRLRHDLDWSLFFVLSGGAADDFCKLSTLVDETMQALRELRREIVRRIGKVRTPAGEHTTEPVDLGESEPVGNKQPKAKTPRKRTSPGDARTKIAAALICHHRYGDGNIENYDPAIVNELAKLADVSTGAVSRFFADVWESHSTYAADCRRRSPELLAKLRNLADGDAIPTGRNGDVAEQCDTLGQGDRRRNGRKAR